MERGALCSRIRNRLREQKGFALSEVIIAGLVMVAAMIHIIRMFDGALGSTIS